jgi:hypothetical protein
MYKAPESRRFWNKKKPDHPSNNIGPPTFDRLQDLSRGDDKLYRALSHFLFLEPKKILLPLEDFIKEAEEHEASGNRLRAELGYRIAGGISLYKGDREGAKRYFSKAASLAANSREEYRTIVERTDDAIALAKKYYEEA